MHENHSELEALDSKVKQEEEAYASVLAAVDALVSFPLPAEKLPEQPGWLERLNELWKGVPAPMGRGPKGRLRRWVWEIVAPSLERQTAFNSVLVQLLNARIDQTQRLHAHLRELANALLRYLQRLLPLVDARDRLASALSTTRAELILESFDRRQESLARRVDGLRAMRDRLDVVSEELHALRSGLAAQDPAPAAVQEAVRAADDSTYVAFENRFRGSPEDVREKLSSYVALFQGLAPVVDLGCGRGEFLELLKEAEIEARGVEANAHVARACRERGLDVTHGDLVAFLQAQATGSLGGIFAAQVAEHLPPDVLLATLRQAFRLLRSGGLLVLETVNPRSVLGFLEVYNRDLTHERPLHPDTLSFLAAAQGFTDVRVELRSPVEPDSRLRAVPIAGLPESAAQALNENVNLLNDLLYAPQEYALLARR